MVPRFVQGTAESMHELKRPFCDEFLTAVRLEWTDACLSLSDSVRSMPATRVAPLVRGYSVLSTPWRHDEPVHLRACTNASARMRVRMTLVTHFRTGLHNDACTLAHMGWLHASHRQSCTHYRGSTVIRMMTGWIHTNSAGSITTSWFGHRRHGAGSKWSSRKWACFRCSRVLMQGKNRRRIVYTMCLCRPVIRIVLLVCASNARVLVSQLIDPVHLNTYDLMHIHIFQFCAHTQKIEIAHMSISCIAYMSILCTSTHFDLMHPHIL